MVLLGAVIEKVSGQSYYDYVRQHIYPPAGMTATGSEPENQAVPGRAVGYMRARREAGGDAEHARHCRIAAPPPAAATRPSGDLLRFGERAERGTACSTPGTHELLTAGKVDAIGGRYAYGFVERHVNGVRSFGHGGNAPGMDADLEMFPESGYVVAVLANVDAPAAQRASEFVINRLPVR